ncbi:MAG: vWA domain-containing protein [Symbiobacteriia bacterium]
MTKWGAAGDPTAQARATERLALEMNQGRGVRLGETAVVSTFVHVLEPDQPAQVRLMQGADAGRVFYGRQADGEVAHLDVFHEVSLVDHRRMAAAIRRVAAEQLGGPEAQAATDWMDIQTGTGGGRVSGSLAYGRKESLRQAHKNHVHVTCLRQAVPVAFLPALVAAVETELAGQGVEIRRVEALEHVAAGDDRAPVDLSPYTDQSDSWLRADDRQQGAAGQPQPSLAEGELQGLADLLDETGSLESLREMLDRLAGEEVTGPGVGQGTNYRSADVDLLRRLEQRGWVRSDKQRYGLTERGRNLRYLLRHHLREVEAQLKGIFRRLPARALGPGTWRGLRQARKVGRGPLRRVRPALPHTWVKELAVAETVAAAARRKLAAGEPMLTIQRADLHLIERSQLEPLDICLLIDASASMAGRRLKAAKFLARHLLLATRDQVSVIAFQEGDVKVHVPFTRNYRRVEAGLAQIRPFGLTPLAHGLSEGCDFIRTSRSRNPLLLLITDGIPTVPKWTVNPIEDALTAAERVAREHIPFGCIGLLPSRTYLENLTRVGGGTLYVLDELDRDALVRIAHTERGKALGASS